MIRFMERSYGIIPLKKNGDQWLTLLVQHRAGHWAFPKGHAEPDETPQQTAQRELHEETALTIKRLLDHTLTESYLFQREGKEVEKTVTYFLAEVEGEVHLQAEEIADFCWLPLEEVEKRATFPETQRLALSAIELME